MINYKHQYTSSFLWLIHLIPVSWTFFILQQLIGDKAKIETKGFSFEDHPFVYRVYQQNVWGAKLIETPKSPKDVSKEFIDFKFFK